MAGNEEHGHDLLNYMGAWWPGYDQVEKIGGNSFQYDC